MGAAPDPVTTPVGTQGTVAATAGGGGCSGAAPSQTPACAGDRSLLETLADVGLDPQRVYDSHHPDSNSAALHQFKQKAIELAAEGCNENIFKILLGMDGCCWPREGIQNSHQIVSAPRFAWFTDAAQTGSHLSRQCRIPRSGSPSAPFLAAVCLPMLLDSNPANRVDNRMIWGQSHVLLKHRSISAFSGALINSYQCHGLLSYFLARLAIGMASETAYRLPPNLETVSLLLRKTEQISIPNSQI
jgi:hypothetical protein